MSEPYKPLDLSRYGGHTLAGGADLLVDARESRKVIAALSAALKQLVEPCECYGRARGEHGVYCEQARAAISLSAPWVEGA